MTDDAAYAAAIVQLAWTLTVIVGFLAILIVCAFVREWLLPWWRNRGWLRRLRGLERGRKAQAGR